MVMHLSGIEHGFVRKFGYEKGIALTNMTSYKVLDEVLLDALKIPIKKETLKLWKNTVAVIPFYGGVFFNHNLFVCFYYLFDHQQF